MADRQSSTPIGDGSGDNSDPRQLLLHAPGELLRCGLAAAHERPLIGVRTDGGVRAWRSPPADAWRYPLVEWLRAGHCYTAVGLDVDERDAIERIAQATMGAGPVPSPSLVSERRASGHLTAVWILGHPVHRGEHARPRPLATLARCAEYYTAAIGADAAYVGVLAANPTHPDYSTSYLRDAGLSLGELAAAVPAGWRRPGVRRLATDAGRNCWLTVQAFRAAGRQAVSDADLGPMVYAANRQLSPPLDRAEVDGIIRSAIRRRRQWAARGWHSVTWLARQATRGRRSGVARRAATADRDAAILGRLACGEGVRATARAEGLEPSTVLRIRDRAARRPTGGLLSNV